MCFGLIVSIRVTLRTFSPTEFIIHNVPIGIITYVLLRDIKNFEFT